MLGAFRIGLLLLVFVVATIGLAGLQALALRLRLFGEHRAPRMWYRLILAIVGVRVTVRGRAADARPLLLAANHVSWLDIMLIGAHAEVHFIAKSDMRGWPGMGRLARLQRTIFVDREQRRRSAEQAGEIGRRLAQGEALVLFAEGTTGDGNLLLPLKTSLFAAAMAAEKPVTVQPLAIAYVARHGIRLGRRERTRMAWIGQSDLLPHVILMMRRRAVDAELIFGEPVAVPAEANRKAIARHAEAEIRRMITAAQRGDAAAAPDDPARPLSSAGEIR